MTIGTHVRLGTIFLAIAVGITGYLPYDTPLAYGAGEQVINVKLASERPDAPVAAVTTTLLSREKISETLTAYGIVRPITSKIHSYTLSYACRIINIMVNKGQAVRPGDALLEISASPDELLKLKQAKAEYSTALTEERLVKKRFNLKLATRSELLVAQSHLQQTMQRLKNFKARGIGANKKIYAGDEGVVYSVESRIGGLIPAGSALLSLIPQNQIKVIFGVEPEDIGLLIEGQKVALKTLHARDGEDIDGHIQMITHQVDPSTRLVTVIASPGVVKGLLLNDFVEVRITTAAHEGLIVPRSAVLSDEQGYTLFTVLNNRAVRHRVSIGLETPEKIEVIAKDIHEGDRVVITGNYELADGMAVKERLPK